MLPFCFCKSSTPKLIIRFYPIAKYPCYSHAFIKKRKKMCNIIIPMSLPIYSYKYSNEYKPVWLAFGKRFSFEI